MRVNCVPAAQPVCPSASLQLGPCSQDARTVAGGNSGSSVWPGAPLAGPNSGESGGGNGSGNGGGGQAPGVCRADVNIEVRDCHCSCGLYLYTMPRCRQAVHMHQVVTTCS